MRHISTENFAAFLRKLDEFYRVFVPVRRGEHRYFRHIDQTNGDRQVGEVRATEPLKAFLFRSREKVAEGFSSKIPANGERPPCVVGVKACDLQSLHVQDFVFSNHDYQDPFYQRVREDALFISADCTCTIDTCFCLSLGVEPFPRENFDINLSSIHGGYVCESGSDKGKSLLDQHSDLFVEATEDQLRERDRQRDEVTQQVQQNIARHEVPHQDQLEGAVGEGFDSGLWEDESRTCVECGACNTICPTCHCFLLCDEGNSERMARFRVWDSCLLKDFARVAGGGNPRAALWMRLRNRFEKKFDYFPKVAGLYACTGCGRCISACPAKIDIRQVLKRLVTHDY